MIRVVLADDQALVRAGFKALVDAQDRVVSVEILSVSKQLPDADLGLQLEVA